MWEKIITIITPLSFLIPTYIVKGTTLEGTFSLLSTVLTIILIIFSVILLILKIEDKVNLHSNGIISNVGIMEKMDIFISEHSSVKNDEIKFYYEYVVSKVDANDKNINLEISDKERKEIYRMALKETKSNCANCGTNPWQYEIGTCQLCGGKYNG